MMAAKTLKKYLKPVCMHTHTHTHTHTQCSSPILHIIQIIQKCPQNPKKQ